MTRTQKKLQIEDTATGALATLFLVESFTALEDESGMEAVEQITQRKPLPPHVIGEFHSDYWPEIRVALTHFIEAHPELLTEAEVEEARSLLQLHWFGRDLFGEVITAKAPKQLSTHSPKKINLHTQEAKEAIEVLSKSPWEEPSEEQELWRDGWQMSEQELYQKASDAFKGRSTTAGKANARKAGNQNRKEWVKIYVRRRAKGKCEYCGNSAPFKTAKGEDYLEPHHTTRLADDGIDHPDAVIALCPDCHRRVHYGADGYEYNELIKKRLQIIVESDPNRHQKTLMLD